MAPTPADPPPPHDGPHPALSLTIGFGVILLGAALVHLVFNAVF